MISITEEPLYLIDFGLTEIYSYSRKLSTAANGSFNVINEQEKGHLLFKEKFVADIRFETTSDNGFLLTCKVKAEMRKNVTYQTGISLDIKKEILSCTCSCPAGQAPASCKHVFASLHALMDYSQKELYLATTERIQAWHRPKPIKVEPKPFHEVFGKNKPCVPKRQVNYEALFTGNQNVQFLSVLSNSEDISAKFSLPLPACVITKNPSFIFHMLSDEIVLFLRQHLQFDLIKIWELENNTREQRYCQLWKTERLYRLTASNFYSICCQTDKSALVQKLLSPQDLSHIPAVKYGIDNESHVRFLTRMLYPTHKFRKVGLVSNPYMPHLGASPDGLLHNLENTMLLEIKCVVNKENRSFEELAGSPSFCLEKKDDRWVLKENHKYYYQIQGQLALTNLTECLFVLYYKEPRYVQTCVVEFNANFWKNVYDKLHNFYINHYLAALMNKINYQVTCD